MTVDVAQLIAAGQPDMNGNIIPAEVREGSASFQSAQGEREPITVIVAGCHINVELGLYFFCCASCSGYILLRIEPDPLFCPLGLTDQARAWAL